jgi:AraC-like DNA-binding protein/mannose-6-phosphate isomerase-like protein (cupin superfamily)
MISTFMAVNQVSKLFPERIEDPDSYYEGVDLSNRTVCRNVIVFERLSRRTLQQQSLANRMHHRHVLIRVLKTAGVVSVDGQSFQLDEGDAILVEPYQFHHFIDLQSDELRWLFITFELAQGESLLTDLSYRSLRPDNKTHILWGEITQGWIRGGAAQRVEVMPMLDLLLMRLRSTMSARNSEVNDRRLSPKNEWIVGIEALIIRSVREGWTFEEVAQRAGLSERQLRVRFEQQMGLSLRDYRSNYQFHTAISLMRDSTRSLTSVAELCGFNSQSVFTRFIRRMVNRTPRELCKQIREGRYVPS